MQENQENFHNKSIKNQVQLLLGVLVVGFIILGIAGYRVYKRFQFEFQNISDQKQQEVSLEVEHIDSIKEPVSEREWAQLEVLPSREIVFSDVEVGSKSEAVLILRAKNGSVVLGDMKLAKEQNDEIVFSGSCVGKRTLSEGDECTLEISWTPGMMQNAQNILKIGWLERNPQISVVNYAHVLLKMYSKNTREKSADFGWEERLIDSNGVIRDRKFGKRNSHGFMWVDGDEFAASVPDKIPLDLKNNLMGIIDGDGIVVDFDGKKIGHLLGDDTIVSSQYAKIIGKAIPSWAVMNEHGHVFGKIVVNLKERAVFVVDAKEKVLGFPHVDGQIVDAQNKTIGFISPRGIVVDSMGGFVGLIFPNASVMNGTKQVATMRPDGKAVDENGKVLGVAVSENGAFEDWHIFQKETVSNQKTDLKKNMKQNKGKPNGSK